MGKLGKVHNKHSAFGTTMAAFPTVLVGGGGAGHNPLVGSLADYLGLPNVSAPVQQPDDIAVSALPFSAYQMIYNDYYRDQNLIPEIDFKAIDGDNTANTELYNLRTRAWEHDYFTSNLPFAQKGTAVSIPLGEIKLKDVTPQDQAPDGNPRFVDMANHATAPLGALSNSTFGGFDHIQSSGASGDELAYDPAGTLQTEPTTINDLRTANALQRWLEKMARGGSRYFEMIKTSLVQNHLTRDYNARNTLPAQNHPFKSPRY